MIGSKRKIKMARQSLLEEGIDPKIIEKVHMPVGLDIGAQTPEEIAICIAAEMIKDRRGGSSHSLKEGPSKKGASTNDSEISSAIDKEVLQEAIRAACDGTPAALATIIKTSGSTPRKAGARMFIHRDGRAFGTIGGGSGELEIYLAALGVADELLPRLHQVTMTGDRAALEGMVCGGMMEVFIEPVNTFRALCGGGIIESE
jgi:xanthine dehydrogenase accessory factor